MASAHNPSSVVIRLLEKEKARSDALFNSVGDGAIVTNVRGNITKINEAALDILGFKKEELIGKWFPSVIVAQDENRKTIANIDRPIVQVFVTGKPVTARLYYLKKDKKRIAVSLTVSPVIVNGKPLGAIEIFRDITKEVELEQAKDEFISLASHQLRTPATGVKQYIGMLLEGYAGELTEEQRNFLVKAYDSNERQIRTINDLLHIARLDARHIVIQKTKVDLAAMAKAVVDEQQATISRRDQKVDIVVQTDDPGAWVDKSWFRMALENMLDNASKYSGAGSTVMISIERSDEGFMVRIIDEGVGIAAADLNRLFQKFSRIENPRSIAMGGTGLGLYLVKRIVDAHDGSIRVSSQEKRGTTFTITLPQPK